MSSLSMLLLERGAALTDKPDSPQKFKKSTPSRIALDLWKPGTENRAETISPRPSFSGHSSSRL